MLPTNPQTSAGRQRGSPKKEPIHGTVRIAQPGIRSRYPEFSNVYSLEKPSGFTHTGGCTPGPPLAIGPFDSRCVRRVYPSTGGSGGRSPPLICIPQVFLHIFDNNPVNNQKAWTGPVRPSSMPRSSSFCVHRRAGNGSR